MSNFGTPLDDVFKERLGDLLDGSLESANTLARLAYLQVAAACPGNPSETARAHIKEDSTHPTDDEIDAQSLSSFGMTMVTFLCTCLLNEMVAHSAPSYAADKEAQDQTLSASVFADLQQKIETACQDGLKSGITSYGVTSTALIHVMDFALHHGVHRHQLTRPLKHCLDMTITEDNSHRNKPSRDQLVDELAARLDVTKATAKKYLRDTRR